MGLRARTFQTFLNEAHEVYTARRLGRSESLGARMLEDAVYYSRREQQEIALAKLANDHRVKQVHLLLANRYAQLAQKALAALPDEERASGGVASGRHERSQAKTSRRLR